LNPREADRLVRDGIAQNITDGAQVFRLYVKHIIGKPYMQDKLPIAKQEIAKRSEKRRFSALRTNFRFVKAD
jgi:hypothetical protein